MGISCFSSPFLHNGSIEILNIRKSGWEPGTKRLLTRTVLRPFLHLSTRDVLIKTVCLIPVRRGGLRSSDHIRLE